MGFPGSDGLKVIALDLRQNVSVGQTSVFVDSNIMRHATVCLALTKGKRGEEGPPGKQGSPVSD